MSLESRAGARQRLRALADRQRDLLWTVLAGVLVFAGSLAQPSAEPKYDAASYWKGALQLAHGQDPYVDGFPRLRGILTTVLYLPAALATRLLGESTGQTAVLVETAVLIAVVGAYLLPRVLRLWGPVTPWMTAVCAGLTLVILGRFAPFALTDLWAAALMIAAIVVLQRPTAARLAWAGLFAGVAFNIRPAYLVPLVLVLTVIVVRERLPGLWFAAGTLAALVPQSLMNGTHGNGWLPWPPDTGPLMGLQASLASYVVRYDTAAYVPGREPQQYFCSPDMAAIVGDRPPLSTGELASLFLHHFPQALGFVAQKAGAALHWPLSSPYLEPPATGDTLFALLVTTVTIVGVVALLRAQTTTGWRSAPVAALVVWAVLLGSFATILSSEPETRFAVPLVLFGIAGCAELVRRRLSLRWGAVALVVVGLAFAVGVDGLSHPAPPGAALPADCAST